MLAPEPAPAAAAEPGPSMAAPSRRGAGRARGNPAGGPGGSEAVKKGGKGPERRVRQRRREAAWPPPSWGAGCEGGERSMRRTAH